jgi:hypothetical protein
MLSASFKQSYFDGAYRCPENMATKGRCAMNCEKYMSENALCATGVQYRKRQRRITLIATVILVLTVAFLLTSCSKSITVVGKWHNEVYAQLFDLKADGSCTLKTATGVFSGIYLFDSKSGQGTIAVLGENISFTVKDDKIILSDAGGTQTEFVRGDMAIAVVTPATTPKSTSAASATAKPNPSAVQITQPPLVTLNPGVILKPGNVIGPIFYSEIVGKWYYDYDTTLEFKSNGFYKYIDNYSFSEDTFTYNPATNEGTLTKTGGGTQVFYYNKTKQMIILYDSGKEWDFIKQAP